MRFAGAAISGDELVLVTVIRSGVDFTIDASASMKLKFNGGADQHAVRAFFSAVAGFVRNSNIDRVAVRGRQAKGKFAGGPVSFKIEGFLQVLENCKTDILMPTTIAAAVKRHKFALPPKAFKYQNDSFLVACCALMA